MENKNRNKSRWFWGIFISLAIIAIMFTGISFLVLAASIFHSSDSKYEYVETGKSGGDKIAVVELDFTILDSAPIVRQFKKYREDKSIKAIILRVNTPGGGVAASQEMYDEVRKTRDSGKPVIVSYASIAASGGYYVSCGGTLIVSNPGTLTGSIGVIISLMNYKDLADKIGIKDYTIKSGDLKDAGNPLREPTKEDKEYFQEIVNDSYEQFLDVVSRERKIDKETLRPLANGRVFTGRQALEYHLVDSLGSFEDAIRIAAGIAKIEGEPTLVKEKRNLNILELLMQNFSGNQIKEIKEDVYNEFINKPVLQYKFER